MNAYQRLAVALGAAVVALMCLFPPWLEIIQFPDYPRREQTAGYHALWKAPASGIFSTARIDTRQLSVQVIAATMASLALLFILKFAKPRRKQEICAACESGDHSLHDDDSCSNPTSRDPRAGQCECSAKVPNCTDPSHAGIESSEMGDRRNPKSSTESESTMLSPQTQRRLESWKRLVVRGRHLRKLREGNSPNGHHGSDRESS